MLYIVDGTGDSDPETYDKTMKDGFCRLMDDKYKGTKYVRGPSILGYETLDIAKDVYRHIIANPMLKSQPLFLAGHSRGGAAVIFAAQLLNDAYDVNGQDRYVDDRLDRSASFVDGMFLFDAVDRTTFHWNVQKIPRNVGVACHARRERSIDSYFEWGVKNAWKEYSEYEGKHPSGTYNYREAEDKYSAYVNIKKLDDAMKVRMRTQFKSPGNSSGDGTSIDFGNCGTDVEDKAYTDYYQEKFLGSHGAIGGSPLGENNRDWLKDRDKLRFTTILEADRAAMNWVWAWMIDKFQKLNLSDHTNQNFKRKGKWLSDK
jgi:hypothetical protein